VFTGWFGGVNDSEPLHHAARTGNIVQAHLALMRCPDAVNAPQRIGKGHYPSPIHIAAYRNHVGVLKLLIAHGGKLDDPGKSGWTPLQHAVMRQSSDTADLLLKRGATLDIFSAVGLGKRVEVQHLFRVARALGFERMLANASTPLLWGRQPLLNWAIDGGHLRMVELLVSHGAEVNPFDPPVAWPESPPLHEAIASKRFDIAELLIKHGAKVDAQDYDGYTALHRAVLYRNVAGVRFLLEHRASVQTSLDYYAVRSSHPNGDPRTFFTPLHTAAKYESPELVALLLAHGASLKARDAQGRNPTDVAATIEPQWDRDDFGYKPGKLTPARVLCLKLLYRYGGKPSKPPK
jgi:ankyrin repeat protein